MKNVRLEKKSGESGQVKPDRENSNEGCREGNVVVGIEQGVMRQQSQRKSERQLADILINTVTTLPLLPTDTSMDYCSQAST